MNIDAILRIGGWSRQHKKELASQLRQLKEDGFLTRLPRGLWTPRAALRKIIGRFHFTANGGQVISLDNTFPEPVFIGPGDIGEAWEGDLVQVILFPGNTRGEVASIVERASLPVPCRVSGKRGQFLLCRPVDRHLKLLFSVRGSDVPEGMPRRGDLLAVRPEKPLASDLWAGRPIRLWHGEDNVKTQEEIVKTTRSVPASFPPLALEQAAGLPQAPGMEDLAGREDLRHVAFVTIDGADAKDFDDAIHVEKMDDGWLLRVAIADVAHYVPSDRQPGSLDAEACNRANSWYFPTSVEPMLPEALSNGLCSLKPNADRLAMLAEIQFSTQGKPVATRFAQAIIRSQARLTYEQAYATLRGEPPPEITANVRAMLGNAATLYHVLANTRKKRGALDFDLPEPAYVFDSEGNLEHMGIAERNDAHRLIEEFMIAANEAVARHLGATAIPFLYRCHQSPDPAKLQAFFKITGLAGIKAAPPQFDAPPTPLEIAAILKEARGTPEEYVINRLCLRSMREARYQPDNIGHFGLASKAYCHFTSPIRRYADLLVHRALKKSLGVPASALPSEEELQRIGDHLNKREREAMECERDMAKRLACLALAGHEGEIYTGTISGVTDFGVFMEFDAIPAEGLIPILDLGEDWFEFDPERQSLIGRHNGQSWSLGQRLRARLVKINADLGEISLANADATPNWKKQLRVVKNSAHARPPSRNRKGCNGPPRRRRFTKKTGTR